MKKLVVVLDACILIPMPLCDTLLRTAEASLFRFHTSEQILEETARNLVNLFGSLKLLEILQQQASDLDFELNIILAKLRQNGANNFVDILYRH